MKIRMEDIIFWVLITLIVGIAIWKMIGSPTDTTALISITLFIAGSEILLWKAFFSIDKKTAVGFMKLKNDIDNKHNELKSMLMKNKKWQI